MTITPGRMRGIRDLVGMIDEWQLPHQAWREVQQFLDQLATGLSDSDVERVSEAADGLRALDPRRRVFPADLDRGPAPRPVRERRNELVDAIRVLTTDNGKPDRQ
jgi:hypothetical protein